MRVVPSNAWPDGRGSFLRRRVVFMKRSFSTLDESQDNSGAKRVLFSTVTPSGREDHQHVQQYLHAQEEGTRRGLTKIVTRNMMNVAISSWNSSIHGL